jgi:hypothetical protein
MATNQFQKLKASFTNYLLSLLIAIISWIGKEQYNALKEISSKLEGINERVVVHETQITALKITTEDLNRQLNNIIPLLYEKSAAKHEPIFQLKTQK